MSGLTLAGGDHALDDTLVFMHLPKTGGTSVRNAVRGLYAREETALIYGNRELLGAMTRGQFDALSVDATRQLRLVMGHFAYGIHRQIDRPCRYATVVRDPVERVISLYSHFLNLPGIRFGGRAHRERLRIRWRRIDLDRWVFGEERIAADNLLARQIAGGEHLPFGQCDEALYQRAVENLERHFVAVLVTEEMELGRRLLGGRLGRELPAVGTANANPNRKSLEEFDPAVLVRIRELNHLDARLHRAARAWLESQEVGLPR